MANQKIDVSSLEIGCRYSRIYLAEIWNYAGVEALLRGIVNVHGSNVVVLFTTENKGKDVTQYRDYCKNGELVIDGQTKHGKDKAVLNSGTKFYSFYRREAKKKNSTHLFVYQGEVRLIREKCVIRDKDDPKPCKFHFKILSEAGFIENVMDE